jgi:hypothetical protein
VRGDNYTGDEGFRVTVYETIDHVQRNASVA